ncbi:hypothetical protein ACJ72_01688 [Emergomyces africanus]|uniref:Uncharacterized protein n=1 Tax=Emergomyces africanus TaxID=1955775 RepID=A0A1B7P4Z9_9EURO|nr:hypothetical protein ACJ72_01688 [Emergomyces africanus]
MKYFGNLLAAALLAVYTSPVTAERQFVKLPLQDPQDWLAGRVLQGFELRIRDVPYHLYTEESWQEEMKKECRDRSRGLCQSILTYVEVEVMNTG